MSENNHQPYDPQNPDMPPLINDVVMSEDAWRRFNAVAAECHKIAAATGLPGLIILNAQGKIVWTPWPPRE
jgi:hypothetical protein